MSGASGKNKSTVSPWYLFSPPHRAHILITSNRLLFGCSRPQRKKRKRQQWRTLNAKLWNFGSVLNLTAFPYSTLLPGYSGAENTYETAQGTSTIYVHEKGAGAAAAQQPERPCKINLSNAWHVNERGGVLTWSHRHQKKNYIVIPCKDQQTRTCRVDIWSVKDIWLRFCGQ